MKIPGREDCIHYGVCKFGMDGMCPCECGYFEEMYEEPSPNVAKPNVNTLLSEVLEELKSESLYNDFEVIKLEDAEKILAKYFR